MRRRGLVLLAVLVLPAFGEPTHAAGWVVDDENSRLGFVASWAGEPFAGTFRRFQADIELDPDRLAASRFEVSVDVTSADTRNRDRDREMGRPAWLDFERFPAARFVTTGFRRLGPDRYEAEGVLTIKGASRAIALPFTWRQADGTARMQGTVVLDRTAFGVGEGEFATGEEVGLDVRVEVDLLLVSPSEHGECEC